MSLRFGLSWSEVIYWAIAATMAAAFAATWLAMMFDSRTIDGYASVWAKPLKFELSLALHAATLALASGLLSAPHKHGAVMLVIACVFLAACVVEMGYIIVQGALGQHSHFNVGTPFHRFMYSVMAFAAVIIVGAAGAVGLASLIDRDFAASYPIKMAIGLGFIGGTILTLITAFTIGGRMSPYVGGVPDFASRMALTGWSKSSGDLRVSHFLATHMIQALPLVGLLLDRILAGRAALIGVIVFAALWIALTFQEYRAALAGNPSVFATTMRS